MTQYYNIYLIFDDWREMGKSIYQTEKGVELSMGDFHSGTTFAGKIALDDEDAKEWMKALRAGFQPAFWVMQREPAASPHGSPCGASAPMIGEKGEGNEGTRLASDRIQRGEVPAGSASNPMPMCSTR